MNSSMNKKGLLIKDLVLSGFTIFIVSIFIEILYGKLWAFAYVFGNVLTLVFLRWLYQDSWNTKYS